MHNSVKQFTGRLSRQQLVVAAVVLLLIAALFVGRFSGAAVTPAADGLAAQSFLILALLAFFGGVISFVSPCTLPILPAYFAFASGSGRSRIALNTVFFMLGVATMFSLLGASASALGSLLIQNQQLLLLVGGAIVIGFGVMSLLGQGFSGVAGRTQDGGGTTGPGQSYLFGLSFSLGWSSCVGPILGVVLTLAASTGSVLRGVVLLFIYTVGLGLPLIVVSTFFGRASRQSLIWRLLRGKGTVRELPHLAVSLPWALSLWVVVGSFAGYAYATLPFFAGYQFGVVHWLLLLLLAFAGAIWWSFTAGGGRVQLELHSSQIASGVLFILMGVLLLSGALADFNRLIPTDLAIWFATVEERLIALFS